MADQPSAAVSDDHAGLLAVFLSYRSRLAQAVRRIVRRHEIDDILQETFIRSFETSRRNTIHHPRAFLLRTARNLALNHAGLADNRCIPQTAADLEENESQRSEPLESAIESNERFRIFCRAVRRLPEQCRHVFILRMVYGLRQREIATRTGLSESTIEKHIAKGLLMCREYLDVAGYATSRAAAPGRKNGKRRSQINL